jgi:hypothetical protein
VKDKVLSEKERETKEREILGRGDDEKRRDLKQ